MITVSCEGEEEEEEEEGWRVGVVVGVLNWLSGPDEQIDTISSSEKRGVTEL